MEPYVGEIKLWALTFAPNGWAICNGALLQIRQNQALFSLLGTRYGGDGVNTFAVPDLRGRVPVNVISLSSPAQKGGSEAVTLTPQQVPAHSHPVNVCADAANKPAGLGNHIAASVNKATPPGAANLYVASNSNLVSLDPTTVNPAGSNAPHSNVQPFLAINYFIATTGIFPPRP